MSEGRATARYVRGSPQKARLVLDLIRGQDVDKAMATLRFARKGVAKDVAKVLRSAVANAQQKEGGGEIDGLYVQECFADQGPTLKRIRAAPMGRAFRILKRTSHLTVKVGPRVDKASLVTRVGDSDTAPEVSAAKATKKTAKKATKKTKKKTAKKKTTKKKTAKKATKKKTAKKAAKKTTKKKTTKKV